ncbi:MAG: UDP-N-acetylmuramate--L-alanine ligase [Longimonas sp.]|uniref:UDP-N-acetylmuramate--L-alanine ligase n=1 Tax=Longimonas sp. TaxID=2039626 RepID=UPI00334D75DC
MSDTDSLRTFERPPVPAPEDIADVYLIGICGTGMGSLAQLFDEAGYTVRGSDEAAYPPMSTQLEARGIEVLEGYDPAHLSPAPDLTVVGNACTPTHPEATHARENNLVQQSFPEALGRTFLTDDRRSIVVAGTHGKTTTTALLVHTLRAAEADPGYLIGGVLANTGKSAHLGTDQPFVVEGDEYDSAYFDARPKFMHYRPDKAIVTSLEFDHADVFDDEAAYREAFEAFVGTLGARDGLLVLCGDDPAVARLAAHTDGRVRTYGIDPSNDVTVTNHEAGPDGQRFTITMGGLERGTYRLPLHGTHNLQNALAVALIAFSEGCNSRQVARGFESFEGVARRQEIRGVVRDITVIDDFAHHPTAVKTTLKGLRTAYPGRRLVAAFEPRSNTSRRARFTHDYATAFDAADQVVLSTPPFRHNDDPDDRLDIAAVATTLRERGVPATVADDPDDALQRLKRLLTPGDVVVTMSNGSFGHLPARLLEALAHTD